MNQSITVPRPIDPPPVAPGELIPALTPAHKALVLRGFRALIAQGEWGFDNTRRAVRYVAPSRDGKGKVYCFVALLVEPKLRAQIPESTQPEACIEADPTKLGFAPKRLKALLDESLVPTDDTTLRLLRHCQCVHDLAASVYYELPPTKAALQWAAQSHKSALHPQVMGILEEL